MASHDDGPPSLYPEFDMDPFSFLVGNDAQPDSSGSSIEETSGSSRAGSPPDWTQFSNIITSALDTTSKFPEHAPMSDADFALSMGMDLSMMGMDLDFAPALAIEPSALHFDSKSFPGAFGEQQQPPLMQAFHPGQFLQTSAEPAQQQQQQQQQQPIARRLSITSSSSSSGASLSPVMDSASTIATSPASDAASELAQRVRQSAGVTLAVPVHGQALQLQTAYTEGQKVPIPRLPRPNPPAKAAPSSSASSPSAPSLSPSPGPTSHTSIAPGTSLTGVLGRPKTSHTTIERRYRTNLNARIQSLKDAVPALRVLDLAKKKGADDAAEKESWGDIVDARGYADGVKVARKISKANVLGKAAEYIRVLKRREARLKREQDGLRSLVSGLVGGPALLREWEREWTARFGGPERDEVDHADSAATDDEGDDDGSDDEDAERARKKAKVAAPKKKAAPAPVSTAAGAPEKRKRGRPRKVVPPVPTLTPAPVVAEELKEVATAGQPPQYLLAAFAFFSFFNSPLTAQRTTQAHTHSGSVVGASPAPVHSTAPQLGWRDAMHGIHLLVSVLLLVSVVMPWLSRAKTLRFRRLSSYIPLSLLSAFAITSVPRSPSEVKPVSSAPAHGKSDTSRRLALIDALAPANWGRADEAARLRAALGVHSGLIGLLQCLTGRGSAKGIERMQLEQRAWVRLGELVALDESTPLLTRLQAFWGMRTHTSAFATSTNDLATLALIVRPLSAKRAVDLWARAARTRVVRPHERLALRAMGVDGAAAYLARADASAKRTSPMAALALGEVRRRMRLAAAALFVRAVLGARDDTPETDDLALHDVVDAGRALGGRTAELASLLERVAADEFVRPPPAERDADAAERGIRTLLGALLLFRRLFPSTLLAGAAGPGLVLSPPPSPSAGNARMRGALRVVLDEEVFEAGEEAGLEDARDRVVDLLVEAERAGKGRATRV